MNVLVPLNTNANRMQSPKQLLKLRLVRLSWICQMMGIFFDALFT